MTIFKSRKLPRAERFYVRTARMNQGGTWDAEIASRKRGQVMFINGFVDFNAVRVAGQICAQLNSGKLR